MKTSKSISSNQMMFYIAFILMFNFCFFQLANALTEDFTEYKGIVIDKQTNKPLAFASIFVNGTGSTTVTNSDGEFSVKLPPTGSPDVILTVKYIGY